MSKNFVIIGGDAAGMSAASKLRRLDPEASIEVFERGDHISYAACGMPYWIGNVIKDGAQLEVLTPQVAREKRNIAVVTRHQVESIHPASQTIQVRDIESGQEREVGYDKLLIATGARAALPPIPGMDHPGVFTLRSLADGKAIKAFVETHNPQHATIIGAGYIGLEMAEAFRELGMDVTLFEMLEQVAPTFDPDMMNDVEAHIREQGVDLRLKTGVKAISSSEGRLIVDTSNERLNTDLVIVSTGVRPNSELAREADLELGESGAIRIDQHMQTSDLNIFAAGDCAEHQHRVLGEAAWIPLAPAANKGGRIAGENMGGMKTIFPGILGTAVVKVFDLTIAQTGVTENQMKRLGRDEQIRATVITAGSKAHYYPGSTPVTVKLITDRESRKLLGAQMVGRSDVAKRLDVLATAITAGMTVDEISMLDLTYAPPFAPVYDPVHIAANVAVK